MEAFFWAGAETLPILAAAAVALAGAGLVPTENEADFDDNVTVLVTLGLLSAELVLTVDCVGLVDDAIDLVVEKRLVVVTLDLAPPTPVLVLGPAACLGGATADLSTTALVFEDVDVGFGFDPDLVGFVAAEKK